MNRACSSRARLREQLLELIDDEQQPARRDLPRSPARAARTAASGVVVSSRSAPSASPSANIGDRSGPQRANGPTRRLRALEVGEHSCFDQRRLTAPRRADEAQHPLRREPVPDLGDLLLPPEEPRRVGSSERHHARVRARRDRVDDLLQAPNEALDVAVPARVAKLDRVPLREERDRLGQLGCRAASMRSRAGRGSRPDRTGRPVASSSRTKSPGLSSRRPPLGVRHGQPVVPDERQHDLDRLDRLLDDLLERLARPERVHVHEDVLGRRTRSRAAS